MAAVEARIQIDGTGRVSRLNSIPKAKRLISSLLPMAMIRRRSLYIYIHGCWRSPSSLSLMLCFYIRIPLIMSEFCPEPGTHVGHPVAFDEASEGDEIDDILNVPLDAFKVPDNLTNVWLKHPL